MKNNRILMGLGIIFLVSLIGGGVLAGDVIINAVSGEVNATTLNAPTGRVATYVVCANDSVHKAQCDYVCDGVADQVQIQAAIDALSGSGGTITLSEGEYLISTTINMTVHGVTLQGMGRGGFSIYGISKLKLADGANSIVLSVTSNSCHLRDFWVNGNKVNNPTGSYGISFVSNDASIEDVFVRDAKGYGYYIVGQASQFRHVQASYSGERGFHIAGSGTQYCTFIDCITCCNTKGGFFLNSAGVNNAFLGCHSIEDKENGFKLVNTQLTSFMGCTVYNSDASGFVIHGNSNRNSFYGCQVKNPSQCANNTYHGFYLYGTALRNVISGCHVIGLESNRHKYGISELDGTADYNIFTNNVLENGITGALNLKGTHTIVQDNIGYTTKNSGNVSKSNTNTTAHGLDCTPEYVSVTSSNAEHIAAVTAKSSSTFTLGLKNYTGGAITVAEEIFWYAEC